jgi:nucleoside-diphosphate kinase
MAERTLVLIKPDGVRRGLVGEVIARIERRGFTVAALELRTLDRETCTRHYAEHEGKAFFEPLVEFMTSGPVVALIAEGERVIETFRSMAGATDPVAATPGSIRGDLGRAWETVVTQNLVHGSDSADAAKREIGIFFPEL